jgi:hypothetical protein
MRVTWTVGSILASIAVATVVTYYVLEQRSLKETGDEVRFAPFRRVNAASAGGAPGAVPCGRAGAALVVVTHGLGGSIERLQGLLALAAEAYPEATIVTATYPVGVYSNSSPFLLSHRLEDGINRHFTDCKDKGAPYGRIVLVGYSAGALLIRKAFLYGLGRLEDHPTFAQGLTRSVQDWAAAVERIVLLAGMNRGWSLEERRPGFSFGEYWAAVVFGPVLQRLGVSKFLYDIERGSPFVVNLRLQWVTTAAKIGEKFPTVVQILGSDDEYVGRADQMDLDTARGFYFLEAGKVDHTSVASVELHETARRAVTSAFIYNRKQLAEKAAMVGPVEDERRIAHYIFIRHGIRDTGEWMGLLEAELCKRALNAKRPCRKDAKAKEPLTKVDIDRYSYFGMLPFLIPALRNAKVREFLDSYTEAIAKTGNPDLPVDYIGHSHGTFILAKGLETYRTLKINKAVFANSVVNISYPWDKVTSLSGGNRLRDIRNYSGDADIIVATFPRLFEKYTSSELGSAGYVGFDKSPAVNNHFVLRGRHSVGVAKENHQHIADYLFDGAQVPQEKKERGGWVFWAWKFPELGWIVALAVGAAVLFALVWILKHLFDRVLPPGPAASRTIKVVTWFLALLGLGWLLNYV